MNHQQIIAFSNLSEARVELLANSRRKLHDATRLAKRARIVAGRALFRLLGWGRSGQSYFWGGARNLEHS
ncbi:hypothetical protein WOA01_00170 [Methylocystis sp. IM2]|uniref:hypothetical protein n=1 Tax=unclassified Methylocystis TaxID=2625913 RepID=UPI0030F77854